MSGSKTIRAVFFDVGNTLLYPSPSVSQVCRDILAEEGIERDLAAIEALMPLVDQYYEDRYCDDDTFWTDHGETTQVWIAMYSLLFRELGVTQDVERIAHRVYYEFGHAHRWRPFDDVEPALRRLSARGLQLGIISNWDRRLSSLLEGVGLGGYLSTVVSSADVGLHKPDPRIFEIACRRLGVSASESVHVGDHHYADVTGATAAGMTAVWIDRDTSARASIVRRLKSLDGIEEALGMRR